MPPEEIQTRAAQLFETMHDFFDKCHNKRFSTDYEFADTTQAYVGAGDYVISGKRKSNAFAKRSALAAALGKKFGTKDTVVELGLIKTLENLETKVDAIPVAKIKAQVIVIFAQ